MYKLLNLFQSGDARVAMVGFPSVGKSTLLSTITKTESAQASYEFTTLTCIPGVIEYKNANIQVIMDSANTDLKGKFILQIKICKNFALSEQLYWTTT